MFKRNFQRAAAIFLTLFCLTSLLSLSFSSRSQKDPEENSSSCVYDGDEIIILWKDGTYTAVQNNVLSAYADRLAVIENFDGGTLCRVSNPEDLVSISNALSYESCIEVAEPNYELLLMTTSQAPAVSNDYFSYSQWSLHNTGSYIRIAGSSTGIMNSAADIDIDAPEGWTAYEDSVTAPKEVIIAVIDTGIDYQHPDLQNCMWINDEEIPNDGIDNDGNGYIDDVYGWDYFNDDNTICHYEYSERLNANVALQTDNDNHGTHIAGIIAATINNTIGIAGIASDMPVKLMSLKIHNGVDGKGTVENAVKAIKYATMMGADICNMSWGTSIYSAALETAMKESDMLFVVAAGNGGTNNDKLPVYPASFGLDNVISTTFIDANGSLTQESNYGVSSVDIAAPGTDIFSTVVGSYSMMSGSSMAVPHVVAVAAMFYSAVDGLYPSSAKEMILATLKPLDSLNDYVKYPGIPSLYNAVMAIEQLKTDNEAPSLKISSDFNSEYLRLIIESDDTGGSGLRIMKYAYGTKTMRAFRHGTAGVTITGSSIDVLKAGTYTFYASDYAGNETLVAYVLSDDTVPPSITPSSMIKYDYGQFSLLFRFDDLESGVKQVKLLPGEHSIADFLSADSGTVMKPTDNRLFLRLEDPGTYTLYASDYRGNKAVYVFELKFTATESIQLSKKSIKLPSGAGYLIEAVTIPVSATDTASFTSSDETVASVNRWGYVTAISKGTATITVKRGNVSALLKVTVP